jgi:hypothetical protein
MRVVVVCRAQSHRRHGAGTSASGGVIFCRFFAHGTDAHACKCVGDKTQPIHPAQILTPVVRLVAIHVLQEMQAAIRLQNRFYFFCQLACLRDGPIRKNTGVYQSQFASFIHYHQGLLPQPVHQFIAIRCGQDISLACLFSCCWHQTWRQPADASHGCPTQ